MFDSKTATLICPENDLESRTIIGIAEQYGMDVRKSRQAWGARLGQEPPETFHDLKKYVMVVEMPDPEKEKELEAEGHTVMVIDHHRYAWDGRVEDRYRPLSSLEQFAAKIGHDLSPREKLIAANDTGKIWELAQKGEITMQELDEIREEELSGLGYDEGTLKRSQEDYDGKDSGIDFTNFKMVVTTLSKVHAIADIHQKALVALKLEKKDKDAKGEKFEIPKRAKNLLILTTDQAKEKVFQVNFFGEESYRPDFEALDGGIGGLGSGMNSWKGGNLGATFFWGAKASDPGFGADQAADAALDILLGPDRPLLKFSTVFFYPFSYKKDTKRNIVKKPDDRKQACSLCPAPKWEKSQFDYASSQDRYQEYIYFHSCVRDILFPGSSNSDSMTELTCYHYKVENRTITTANLEVVYGKNEEITLCYPITHLAIHTLMDEVAVLLFQVVQEIDKGIQDVQHLWIQCLHIEKFKDLGLTTSQTLCFNEIVRKIYPSFPQQADEGKMPKRISFKLPAGPPITHDFTKKKDFPPALESRSKGYEPEKSEIINHFIVIFLGHRAFRTILDDRMVLHTFASIAGNGSKDKLSLERHRILFSHYMYVDQYGAGWEYDEAFIKNLMKDCVYHRWRHNGQLFGFTRYSGAYVGSGWFFTNVVFQHFDSMYFQMALLAVFYRAFLLNLSSEIADTTRDLAKANDEQEHRKNFLDLKEKFMKFTNIYWFPEITNQDQGIELFDLYKKSFDFKALYDEVKEEIDRADDYLEAKDQIKFNDLSKKFGIGGFVMATLAILSGLMGMNCSPRSGLFWIIVCVEAIAWFSIFQYVRKGSLPFISDKHPSCSIQNKLKQKQSKSINKSIER